MTNTDPDSSEENPTAPNSGEEDSLDHDSREEDPVDPEGYHIRGEHRAEADEDAPLFAGVTGESRGESAGTEAGLIAGTSEDSVLVAGVGYPLLSDLAFGTVVAHRVANWDVPDVAVADLSHTPLAAYQTISEGDYETIRLVGAEKRGGELNDGTPSNDPGSIHEYGPDAVEMPEDRLTELVGQTAMGFNTLENVVIVTRAFGSFPEDTRIIAVEPEYDSWGMSGEEFSAPVEDAFEAVMARVVDAIEDAPSATDS